MPPNKLNRVSTGTSLDSVITFDFIILTMSDVDSTATAFDTSTTIFTVGRVVAMFCG